jgi:transcriptional regulator with XRE-family HTH domain
MPSNRKKEQTSSAPSALSEAQQRAIAMAAAGSTGRDIATALGVNECTVSRWRQSAEFEAAVNSLLKDAHAAAAVKLRQLTEQAVATIEAVLTDPKASAGDRLKAAALILDRVGMATVPSIGSTDAERIESDRAADEKHQALMDSLSSWSI